MTLSIVNIIQEELRLVQHEVKMVHTEEEKTPTQKNRLLQDLHESQAQVKMML